LKENKTSAPTEQGPGKDGNIQKNQGKKRGLLNSQPGGREVGSKCRYCGGEKGCRGRRGKASPPDNVRKMEEKWVKNRIAWPLGESQREPERGGKGRLVFSSSTKAVVRELVSRGEHQKRKSKWAAQFWRRNKPRKGLWDE